eukprot:8958612-Lingulodinium_polyedra.AAC.1
MAGCPGNPPTTASLTLPLVIHPGRPNPCLTLPWTPFAYPRFKDLQDCTAMAITLEGPQLKNPLQTPPMLRLG